MRKIGCFSAVLVIVPITALADGPLSVPSVDEAKIYYNRGITIELPHMDLKLNVKSQFSYAYNDYENPSDTDVNKFDVRRLRLQAAGHLDDKTFTYKVENDFSSSSSTDTKKGSALKDGWIEWNADPAAILRVGQFKVPFSRQEVASDFSQQFINRSLINDFFSAKRNVGPMLYGPLGYANYAIGVFNGQSDSEGENLSGVDTRLMGAAALNAAIGPYGDRTEEGDFAETPAFAQTVGIAALYGSAERKDVDLRKFDLNGDWGARYLGFSAQSEVYYSKIDPDSGSSLDNWGFYAQTGYFFVPQKWEAALRFGYIDYDKNQGEFDNAKEYTANVTRYIKGHDLKIQSGVTWEQYKANGSGDNKDNFRFELQLTVVI